MKTLYILIEKGVYRHRIFGMYDNLQTATEKAQDKFDCSNKYHSIEVAKIILGQEIYDVDVLVTIEGNYL